jgi:YD repeat-containing protein
MGRNIKILALALIFIFLSSLVPANGLAASSEDSKNNPTVPDGSTASISKIVGEVPDKRNKSTKVYRKDDGSFEAEIFNTAVHYQDSNGQWKEIDNSLIDGKDAKGNDVLKNKENAFSVEFSKNSNGDKLVSITKNGFELSWGIAKEQNEDSASAGATKTDSTDSLNNNTVSSDNNLTNSGSATITQETAASVSASVEQADEIKIQNSIDKIATEKASKTHGYDKLSDSKKAELVQISKYNEGQKTLRKVTSGISFKQIFKDVDVNYAVNGDTVKESIVLNKAAENPVFKFNLNVNNLIPKVDDNKNIVFYDANDEEKAIYIMQAPFMYDSNKESSNNIDISLNKGTEGYVITVKPDASWLNDAKRAYPVTIDPSVKTSIDINSIKDAYVSSALPNTNYYQSNLLKTGYGSSSAVDRTFIKFTNLPQIKSSEMITDACLEVVCCSTQGSHVNVHEVLSDWDSTTITWNNQPTYNSIIEDYRQVLAGNTAYYWDITNVVKKWYSGSGNNGLLLKANYEGVGGYTDYYSSDQDQSLYCLRPKAQISYVDNEGLESYWTYHSVDAGNAGIGYTNDFDGNLIFLHNDLSESGSRMPLSINHVYNSSAAKAWGDGHQWMGAGWSMNVTQRVYTQLIGETNYWVYIDEDGTKHYFVDNGSASLTDELNLGYTFIKETTGQYTIKDKSDNKVKFNWDGMLNSFIDSNNNTITAEYGTASGNGVKILTKLTDGAGRVTNLGYDNNGILVYITDAVGRSTWFSYDTQTYQKLTQITYPDGRKTKFEYDSHYNLLSVTNIIKDENNLDKDDLKVSYEYYADAPYRVKKVLESNGSELGGELNFSYGNNQTAMTDYQGRKNIYQFNNHGNTICVQDNDGNASYYDYSDSSNISKCTLESKFQKTQVNLLLNHNFESV